VSQSERSPALPEPAEALDFVPVELGDGRVPLRLTATRGALGIELYEPVEIGPLEVRALASTLPGLKFPLDLTGGVPVFRHRRGDLEHLEVVTSLTRLGSWLSGGLGDVVGPLERPVTVWSVPNGVGVGLSGARGALAFGLLFAPIEGDARFVIAEARGARLDAPALGHALRVVDTVFGALAERRGRVVTLSRVAARLTRVLLPAIGARAPATGRARLGSLFVEGDEVGVALDSTFEPPVLHAVTARALELAELTIDADDALAEGRMDVARDGYVAAMEHAPRHPELARLVAEIDVFSAGRAEAALGMIVETIAATQAGWIGAELLARTGDLQGAREAVQTMAQKEVFAPLSSLLWLRMAELEDTAPERMAALDRAVAASPGLRVAREARFSARVELGDVEPALSDAEHLEAAAHGARARHEACIRAARALLTHGFVRDAGRLFERALRYMPDDAAATAGLARSLMEAGKSDRAFALLARAVALSERHGRADADALLDMARLLATDLSDLPQAIARARQVPASSARAVEAAALEGQWRAQLGDIAGATLAYARMRDRIELASSPPDDAVEWLLGAARFEREVQDDLVAAERHLVVALRLAPRQKLVADAYRDVARVLAARARRYRADAPATEPPPEGDSDDSADGPPLATLPPEAPDADDHELVERLEAQVRADPDDIGSVLELSDVLVRLDRLHDAHALLSGRLDDAPAERRPDLVPRLAAVLRNLAAAAREQGRAAEAELFETVLARLDAE